MAEPLFDSPEWLQIHYSSRIIFLQEVMNLFHLSKGNQSSLELRSECVWSNSQRATKVRKATNLFSNGKELFDLASETNLGNG